MSALPYMVRQFETEKDYPLLSKWWDVHHSTCPTPPAAMLPSVGVMAIRQEDQQPDACAFLILAGNARLSLIEYPATRPGIGLARARAAFSAIVCVLKQTAADNGFPYMLAYTLPGIARELRVHGFKQGRAGLVCAIALTDPKYGN